VHATITADHLDDGLGEPRAETVQLTLDAAHDAQPRSGRRLVPEVEVEHALGLCERRHRC
jgi:hypothetical protein